VIPCAQSRKPAALGAEVAIDMAGVRGAKTRSSCSAIVDPRMSWKIEMSAPKKTIRESLAIEKIIWAGD